MSSIPSPALSLCTRTLSVAAQRSQRDYISSTELTRCQPQGELSRRERMRRFPRCSLGVFHSDGAGNVNVRDAE